MGRLKLYKGGSTTVTTLNKEPINIAYWYSQTSHKTGLSGRGSKGAEGRGWSLAFTRWQMGYNKSAQHLKIDLQRKLYVVSFRNIDQYRRSHIFNHWKKTAQCRGRRLRWWWTRGMCIFTSNINIRINMHTIVIQCGIGAYDISVACKQRIGDVRHLVIMHIIQLRSSNLK